VIDPGQQLAHARVARAAFYTDRVLTDRRQQFLGRDRHADIAEAELVESGARQDERIGCRYRILDPRWHEGKDQVGEAQ
jgi:hypothetical protein